MDRRTFVRNTGLAVTGSVLAPGCGPKEQAATDTGRSLDRIGLQLYTVRDDMEQSVPNTLAQVAEIGYTEVEFAGYFGHPPAEIRGFLQEFGLASPSAHIPIEQLREAPVATIDMVGEIGHQFLVVPWVAPENRTADGFRRLFDDLNGFGERCRGAGLTLAYHNHDFEFQALEGKLVYDRLLEVCDPGLVKLEMDLFWVRKGGRDPLPYFERYPGRFPLCHVKDMDRQEGMTSVGDGVIDFSRIFAASDQAGLQHYFVEHDQPEDAMASIERSYRFLSTLTF